jgi:hypothetical protein
VVLAISEYCCGPALASSRSLRFLAIGSTKRFTFSRAYRGLEAAVE